MRDMRSPLLLRFPVSLQPVESTTITNPNISTVTFYQGFGFIGHHVLEQYREYDVLSGLGATGQSVCSCDGQFQTNPLDQVVCIQSLTSYSAFYLVDLLWPSWLVSRKRVPLSKSQVSNTVVTRRLKVHLPIRPRCGNLWRSSITP